MGNNGRRGAATRWRPLLPLVAGLTALLVACQGAPAPAPTPASVVPSASPVPSTAWSSAAPTPSEPASPSPSPSPTSAAQSCADKLSPAQLVGQLLMVGVSSTGATASQLQVIAATHAGSVILMGNTGAGVAGVRAVTDKLRAADPATPATILVATDQEGGLVRRLRGPGFTDMPSAATQATWSDAALRAKAETWARELAAAGVNSPLGPVADVVPPEIGRRNQAIGANNRGFGTTPDQVSAKVTAVVQGFRAGGVATGIKHFPGIGRVTGNTDFGTGITDTVTTRSDALLAPFRAGIAAGTDMVMVSTVVYSRIDAKNPAAFSRTVITDLLRGDLGWQGVVISDDLGVASQVSFLAPGARAVAFLRAGGDLVINVDAGTARTMADTIAAEAAKDPGFAAELKAKAVRVLQLKLGRGLSAC